MTYSDSTTAELSIAGHLDLSKVRKTGLDIVELDIGEAVTSIANGAFSNCRALQSVVF